MSPSPRKPRSKSDRDPEKVEGEPTDASEEKPKRTRRKARPDAKAAGAEEKAAKVPRRRRAAKADAPEATAEADAPEIVADAEDEDVTEAVADMPEAAPEATPEAEPEATPEPQAEAEPEVEAQPAEEAPKPRRTRRAKADDKPAEPAPAPKRAARDANSGPPMVRAHAKYVRTSARKARLVCDHIRGKSVEEARAILAHANRDVARDWMKLLESAVANAEHNHELVGDELRIHAVKADEGPTLKRFRPRAMGRATQIRKRTSHLSITLTPKDGE
ncbi:MAG: 50S ribosomal protein L22 [Solirubrobacteraceae bacterium]